MSDPNLAIRPPNPAPQSRVEVAIAQASARTGIDFGYLLAQAKVESSLDIDAKAPTSSATGLFQFIESTWLDVMHRHGGALGYGQWSSQIEAGARGAFVRDPIIRGQILALRNDPQAASLMAGALAQDNSAALTPVLGRAPDAGELYLAHFLGAGGASRFLTALQQRPDSPAAVEFAQPARANRAIFYAADGSARSFAEVMTQLRGKIERAMPQGGAERFAAPERLVSGTAPFSRPQPGFAPFTTAKPVPLQPMGEPKLSDMLRSSFAISDNPDSSSAGAHARRAYERLKAIGL